MKYITNRRYWRFCPRVYILTSHIQMVQFQSKNACINTIFSGIVNLYTGKVFITRNGQLYNNIFIFLWCKRALYSRNSSLWLLRSRKLTGWLKSPDICWGRRGGQGLYVQKNNAIRPRGLFLTIFQTLLFQTWIYIRAANYGLTIIIIASFFY